MIFANPELGVQAEVIRNPKAEGWTVVVTDTDAEEEVGRRHFNGPDQLLPAAAYAARAVAS